jgi:hypothetical protein
MRRSCGTPYGIKAPGQGADVLGPRQCGVQEFHATLLKTTAPIRKLRAVSRDHWMIADQGGAYHIIKYSQYFYYIYLISVVSAHHR